MPKSLSLCFLRNFVKVFFTVYKSVSFTIRQCLTSEKHIVMSCTSKVLLLWSHPVYPSLRNYSTAWRKIFYTLKFSYICIHIVIFSISFHNLVWNLVRIIYNINECWIFNLGFKYRNAKLFLVSNGPYAR